MAVHFVFVILYVFLLGTIHAQEGNVDTKEHSENLSVMENQLGDFPPIQQSNAGCDVQEPPRSCRDILCRNPEAASGVYNIVLGKCMKTIHVYCDMDTEGGGWIIFQRRIDGSENFYRKWADYEKGFGVFDGEFWLGNEYLHLLTMNGDQELRIDLGDFDKQHRAAKYSTFKIGSLGELYKLTISGYSGDAGDSLIPRSATMKFSTYDRDNDKNDGNCAIIFKGAWWYNKCHYSNLNGQYLKGKHDTFADGINWYHWHGYHYSLRYTEMKIRPK